MSTEDNKAVVLRLFDELDSGNPEIFNELCTPDAKMYMPGTWEPFAPSELVRHVTAAYQAFPDYAHRIEDVLADADTVVMRAVVAGTNTGEFMGLPPTGKRVEYGEIIIFRFAGGKIVESWVQEDSLWMMEQLGMELGPQKEEA